MSARQPRWRCPCGKRPAPFVLDKSGAAWWPAPPAYMHDPLLSAFRDQRRQQEAHTAREDAWQRCARAWVRQVVQHFADAPSAPQSRQESPA